jgi:hypothetical protein
MTIENSRTKVRFVQKLSGISAKKFLSASLLNHEAPIWRQVPHKSELHPSAVAGGWGTFNKLLKSGLPERGPGALRVVRLLTLSRAVLATYPASAAKAWLNFVQNFRAQEPS